LNVIVHEAPARFEQPAQTRVVLTRSGNRLAIALPRAGFRGVGCFFTAFSLFWNGVTWTLLAATVGSFYSRSNATPMPLTPATGALGILFFIPFILIGLITAAIAVYCIFGDVALAMDGKAVLFERRCLGRRWTRTFDFANIVDVRMTEAYKQNDVPVYGVSIRFRDFSRAPLIFGSNLSQEEKDWLLGELHAYWRSGGN